MSKFIPISKIDVNDFSKITDVYIRPSVTPRPYFSHGFVDRAKIDNEPNPVSEMAKHFAPDVWAKILDSFIGKFEPILKKLCKEHTDPQTFMAYAFGYGVLTDWHPFAKDRTPFWCQVYDSFYKK